jgi:hypothetical protein
MTSAKEVKGARTSRDLLENIITTQTSLVDLLVGVFNRIGLFEVCKKENIHDCLY